MNAWMNRFSTARTTITRGLMAAMVGATLVGAPMFASTATAQSAGKPHEEVVDVLRQRYAETPAFIALANGGAVLEVFTSPDKETWTIAITLPDGMSRVLAAGESWESVRLLVGQPI